MLLEVYSHRHWQPTWCTDEVSYITWRGQALPLIDLPRVEFDPSTTGFSLTMALGFTGLLLWWVRFLNEFEVQGEPGMLLIEQKLVVDFFDAGNSIERIKAYVEIEQEPKSTDAGTPPAYWPASGSLSVEKLCARYSPDGPEVLHDISFEIKSGEHVGVGERLFKISLPCLI